MSRSERTRERIRLSLSSTRGSTSACFSPVSGASFCGGVVRAGAGTDPRLTALRSSARGLNAYPPFPFRPRKNQSAKPTTRAMTTSGTMTAMAAIAPVLRPELEPSDEEGGVGLDGGVGEFC